MQTKTNILDKKNAAPPASPSYVHTQVHRDRDTQQHAPTDATKPTIYTQDKYRPAVVVRLPQTCCEQNSLI